MSNRALHVKLAGEYRQVEYDACVYCDGPIEAQDHFVPVSYAAYIDVKKEYKVLIPSCRRCNSIAHARVFTSVTEKRDFIIGKRLECPKEGNPSAPTARKSSRSGTGTGKGSAARIAERTTTLLATVTHGVHGKRLTRAYRGYHLLKDQDLPTRSRLVRQFAKEFSESLLELDAAKFLQNRMIELYLGIYPLHA